MNILPLKPKSTASSGAKHRKKVKGDLVVTPVAQTTPVVTHAGASQLIQNGFLGKLTIGDHQFSDVDGFPLGLIAYICNVSSIVVMTPSLPNGITISRSKLNHREIDLLYQAKETYDEGLFLVRLCSSFDQCHYSRKSPKASVDLLESNAFTEALEQVPEHLRINTRLYRGIYDRDGNVLSAKDIAARAVAERRGAQIAEAFAAGITGIFAIDQEDITRHGGTDEDGSPADYVTYGAKAEMQTRRMLAAFGIDTLPLTFSGFKGVLLYCSMLEQMRLQTTGPGGNEMLPHILNTVEKWYPQDMPAFKALLAGDIEALRTIHKENNIVRRMAVEFKETHPQFFIKTL